MIRNDVAADRARAGIVLAHGRGGSARDMFGLLPAAGVAEVAAIAPEAPGHSWWPTSFLAPMAAIGPHLDAALAAMRSAVGALEAEGLSRDRIWFCGFSQGACLALEAFARDGAGLAGVLAFSGGLVGTADAAGSGDAALYGFAPKRFDYAGRRDGFAWISVHARDPHIPVARVRDSAAVLSALGAEVAVEIHPGAGHGVMPADLAQLRLRLADPATRGL